jgi:hypothetical protein
MSGRSFGGLQFLQLAFGNIAFAGSTAATQMRPMLHCSRDFHKGCPMFSLIALYLSHRRNVAKAG